MEKKERIRLKRFCSQDEFDKFIQGETLLNHTDHYKGGRGGSRSIGFCFTIDKPAVAWKYLKGVVDCDVCFIVECNKDRVIESDGKYCENYHAVLKREYCTTMYGKEWGFDLVKVVPMETIDTPSNLEAIRYFRTHKEEFGL